MQKKRLSKKKIYQKSKKIKQKKQQREKEEKISLARKGLTCNTSSKEQKNDTEVSEVLCEFCNKSYDSASLLMHIAKNEECKIFYGSRFDKMKKDHKRRTNKKDLKKQRKRYVSNPEVKLRKKKYYQEEKKMQAIWQK